MSKKNVITKDVNNIQEEIPEQLFTVYEIGVHFRFNAREKFAIEKLYPTNKLSLDDWKKLLKNNFVIS